MMDKKKDMFKHARKTHVLQYNQSWCGVACMASVVKYHGGVARQEQMIANSGTTITGTTLLGLYQLASTLGLDAEGCSGTVEQLKEIVDLSILHTVNEKGLQHYVVCYGWNGSHFIVGDPASGVTELTAEEVEEMWKSKSLLLVKPNSNFVVQNEIKSQRWQLAKQLTRNDWGVLGVAMAMGIVLAGLGLSLAIFSQKLIDKILPGGDLKRLMVSLAVVALLLMAKNLIAYLRGLLMVRQSKDFGNRVVSWFFGISILLPKNFYDSLKTGDMVARLNDTRRLQQVINTASSTLIIDFLGLVASLSLLVSYSWWLGITSMVALIIFPLLTFRNSSKIKSLQKEVMGTYANSESSFVNTIQCVEAIKSTQTENAQVARVTSAYSDYQEKAYDLGIFSNKLNLFFQIAATIILMVTISFGAYGVFVKWLTVGELMAAISLSSTVVGTSASLSLAVVQYQEANVAFSRLFEFVQGPKEQIEQPEDSLKVETISVRDVSFRYPGRSLLLNKVSLTLNRAEVTCLIGDVGSGKSTLLQILQRYYTPQNGEVTINGEDWSTLSTSTIRKKIVAVPQEVKFINATLAENIAMTSNMDDLLAVEEFCRHMGFEKFFLKLPIGLLTPIGEDGVNLSGGQRQLLGLCRGLFRNPDVLLLDEPTASLDKEASLFVKDTLDRIRANTAILIVTHLPELMLYADKIYSLKDAEIVEEQSTNFQEWECYRHLLDSLGIV